MKKLYLLLMPLFMVILTGCGSSSEKLVCTMEQTTSGIDIKMTYTLEHDGTYVSSARFYEEYINDDDTTLEAVKKQVEDTYNSLNEKYGGYTINISKKGNKIVSDVKIDYTKANMDKLLEDNPSLSSYVENGKMLLSQMKSQYASSGLTCK